METRKRNTRTHGMTDTAMYRCWQNMRNRCNNPNVKSYHDYGARGIRVCERWRNFANFLADMGMPPTPRHEIDRIDNDGPYAPENCRWVTSPENRAHRRNIIFLTVDGETRPLMEWARSTGLKQSTLYHRVTKGWDHERAVKTPC